MAKIFRFTVHVLVEVHVQLYNVHVQGTHQYCTTFAHPVGSLSSYGVVPIIKILVRYSCSIGSFVDSLLLWHNLPALVLITPVGRD